MEQNRPGVGVGVIIERGGKILVGRRLVSHGSGTWQIPGGHLEFGEEIADAAIREAVEETGLQCEYQRVICVNNDIAYDKHYVSIGVLLYSTDGEPLSETGKTSDWYWCDPKKLPSPFFPHSEKVIRCYIKGLFTLS